MFSATLQRAIDVEHPPPSIVSVTLATNLNGLSAVPERSFFRTQARKRLVVVLTDGETEPLEAGLATAFGRAAPIETVFVRFGSLDERIYATGVAEGGYSHDAKSRAPRARGRARRRSRSRRGRGRGRGGGRAARTGRRADRLAQAGVGPSRADAVADAGRAVPLAVVLLRRNVWWTGLSRVEGRVPSHAPGAAKVSEPRGVAQPG